MDAPANNAAAVGRARGDENGNGAADGTPSLPVRTKLYTSHFLSTWNSRVFEFGAVLFLSTIFPGTLLPASVYALARAASVVLLSGFLGLYIDHGQRMQVVRVSIVGQRIATALSCLLLLFMTTYNDFAPWLAHSLLAVLCMLACVEKLSSVMNTIAIERDWVVILSKNNERDLQELNSQMRRIDLFCKLVGPLAISLIDGFSTKIAVLVTLGMTCVSVIVEYLAIARVYSSVEDLQQERTDPGDVGESDRSWSQVLRGIAQRIADASQGLDLYFHHRAFLPSFSLSLLYLTVFSFGGQMVTYLLSIGFSSLSIGLLRTVSTVFELSATWLSPKVMDRIGAVRGGIWFLNWQIICVALALTMLWLDISPTYTAGGLLVGVILSRVGLWGFDLSAQIIVQESVEASQRGSFSALEASVQNTFELLSFASTVVFAKPEQFKFPAAISGGAVVTAGILYAFFVRQRRGHLFHRSKCMKGRHDQPKRRYWRGVGPEWERIPQAEDFGDESQGTEA
ncbi:hypothetical protein MBLNU459_g7035t1 [Dothideomycetes sp. NU459]